MKVKIWDKEIKGKLYAVGDIHGCYNLLMNRLKEIVFDFENGWCFKKYAETKQVEF